MKQLITALILTVAAITTHASTKDEWIYSVASKIHSEVKVQKIDSEAECLEISRNLKGPRISYTGDRNEYGTAPTFYGQLNSKGQYIEFHCSRKRTSWALIAPKSVIDSLIADQKKKQTQRSQHLNNKVKSSGLL